MRSSLSLSIILILASFFMGACDPEALVKSKVPKELQELLTFEGAAGIPFEQSIKITSPKNNQAFDKDTEITFAAELAPPGRSKPDLKWELKEKKAKAPKPLGSALTVKDKPDRGEYTATLTATRGEKKTQAKVNFRVGRFRPGTVNDTSGKGLPQTAIIMTDAAGSEISSAHTEKDGSFKLDYPTNETVTVSPRKAGYSFTPDKLEGSFEPKPLVFEAYQGEIGRPLITETLDEDRSIINLCPGRDLFLRADIQSTDPLKDLSIIFVATEDKAKYAVQQQKYQDTGARGRSGSGGIVPETVVSLGDALKKEPHQVDATGRRVLPFRVPGPRGFRSIAPEYEARIVAHDVKGRRYETAMPGIFVINTKVCFKLLFDQAVELQKKGQIEDAERIYKELKDFYQQARDLAPLQDMIVKVDINLGLAMVARIATAKEVLSVSRAVDLLDEALKRNRKDAEIFALKGMAYQKGSQDAKALEMYKHALDLDPSMRYVRLLRAELLLRGGGAEKSGDNLLDAVNDLTGYLETHPKDTDVRKARTAVFMAYADKQPAPEVTLPPMDKVVDFKRFIRN